MSTAHIWNGFGRYETRRVGNKDEFGITLTYAGVAFWLPYEQVTYIPDFTIREVDHDKSSADTESESVLTYKTFVIRGERIAEELTEVQQPYKNSQKGIIVIFPHNRKFTDKYLEVRSGFAENGEELTAEVREIIPTDDEKKRAAKLADDYKRQVVTDYFNSKRERMAGGKGLLNPGLATRRYMDELGIKDIDALERHIDVQGLNAELLSAVIEQMRKANELNGNKLLEAIETINRNKSGTKGAMGVLKGRTDGLELEGAISKG